MYITVIDFCRSKITISKIEKIEDNADIEELIMSVYPDYKESYKYIEKLTKNGKGRIYSLNENVFAHNIIYGDLTYNPQLGLIILALILFLLDIAVRKFNWKWPHEIWGKKKKTEEALI